MFTSHNHQESVGGTRLWPSGVYYLSVPDDPFDSANWQPVPIDTGDAYVIDREGGPYSQGSPGFAAVGDITGNSLSDFVVAGDGRGALYYYEAVEADGACSLQFKRGALYDDPASMPAEIKLYDVDNDGELEILATVYDTSQVKDGSSGSVFIWDRKAQSDCELIVEHKTIKSEKLSKDKKVTLKISSDDEAFDIYGALDLGQLEWQKSKYKEKKNKLKIKVIVPAGLEPQVIPISVGTCVGAVVIE
jgi:hypothetical protein